MDLAAMATGSREWKGGKESHPGVRGILNLCMQLCSYVYAYIFFADMLKFCMLRCIWYTLLCMTRWGGGVGLTGE
jgi:hypothetical protein